jgi:hypothetical protein
MDHTEFLRSLEPLKNSKVEIIFVDGETIVGDRVALYEEENAFSLMLIWSNRMDKYKARAMPLAIHANLAEVIAVRKIDDQASIPAS